MNLSIDGDPDQNIYLDVDPSMILFYFYLASLL